ncbi:LLM class flavin-dependent oxidoreductase [Pseudobacillus badius]|uniref:LLM class flavin-dependent oxidoreductase n=1 Tax=Bacillus badius TaxID=1455 RepID=UPI0007B041EC|nr:LLM class flavin-dependent oxidoreductase [Bacillus badius]KZN98359.1 luciferase [Bacillus badius]OCS82728.1 luciferase [Bacillus badius]OVE51434.1 luciferase family oxidoreductase [Bacillus badius]TDW02541.1 luciferase family oxidoreductase group 1 [Bacillus badius]
MTAPQPKHFQGIPLSVLDLAPILEGSTAAQSFKHSTDLAQHAEKWGFSRYWLAEHHNMPGIASSATSVMIGHIAGATEHIRVGSGGIMLPNHAALVIAEQFGTLESLYPGRIDLGIGRAPGSDQATAFALRRTLHSRVEDFHLQLDELQAYFDANPSARVRAFPGEGLNIPIWLLGSSDFSARLAAEKGLPFAFASHFAADYTLPALNIYRGHFTPSNVLEEPYAMVGVNIIAADTEERARWLATSQQQQFLSLRRGEPTQLKPPIDDIDQVWSPFEQAAIEQTLDSRATIIGTPDTVKQKLERFLAETKANEIIVNSQIFCHEDRLRSYEIVAGLME